MKKPVAPKASFLDSLSPRDRKLLKLLPVIPTLALVVIGGVFFARSIDSVEQEVAAHRSTLEYLAKAAPEFVEKQARAQGAKSHKTMDEEKLKSNNIKLTSFVAEHAAAAEITIASYDEDEMPFGGSGKSNTGPIITERQLRIEVREAQMSKLLDLLDRIEKSSEPVYIKRLDIRDIKKAGDVRAVVTVSTFIKKEKAG